MSSGLSISVPMMDSGSQQNTCSTSQHLCGRAEICAPPGACKGLHWCQQAGLSGPDVHLEEEDKGCFRVGVRWQRNGDRTAAKNPWWLSAPPPAGSVPFTGCAAAAESGAATHHAEAVAREKRHGRAGTHLAGRPGQLARPDELLLQWHRLLVAGRGPIAIRPPAGPLHDQRDERLHLLMLLHEGNEPGVQALDLLQHGVAGGSSLSLQKYRQQCV